MSYNINLRNVDEIRFSTYEAIVTRTEELDKLKGKDIELEKKYLRRIADLKNIMSSITESGFIRPIDFSTFIYFIGTDEGEYFNKLILNILKVNGKFNQSPIEWELANLITDDYEITDIKKFIELYATYLDELTSNTDEIIPFMKQNINIAPNASEEEIKDAELKEYSMKRDRLIIVKAILLNEMYEYLVPKNNEIVPFKKINKKIVDGIKKEVDKKLHAEKLKIKKYSAILTKEDRILTNEAITSLEGVNTINQNGFSKPVNLLYLLSLAANENIPPLNQQIIIAAVKNNSDGVKGMVNIGNSINDKLEVTDSQTFLRDFTTYTNSLKMILESTARQYSTSENEYKKNVKKYNKNLNSILLNMFFYLEPIKNNQKTNDNEENQNSKINIANTDEILAFQKYHSLFDRAFKIYHETNDENILALIKVIIFIENDANEVNAKNSYLKELKNIICRHILQKITDDDYYVYIYYVTKEALKSVDVKEVRDIIEEIDQSLLVDFYKLKTWDEINQFSGDIQNKLEELRSNLNIKTLKLSK